MGMPSSGMTRVKRGGGWEMMPASEAPEEVQQILAAYSPGGSLPGGSGSVPPPNLSSTWGVPDSAWTGVGSANGPQGILEWLLKKYGQ